MNEGGTSILVIDEDPVFRGLLTTLLQRDGFAVEAVAGAQEAVSRLERADPDLIVLDLDLPEMGGLDLLNRIRASSQVPIMIVSARSAETERVLALDMGADDYVLKPFLPREFGARVRSLLRRTRPAPAPTTYTFGPLEIRVATREALVSGRVAPLTPKEFDVLAYFAGRPRQVVSRRELLDQVWKSSEQWQDLATVTEHVRRLRHKIEPDPANPRWLRAVRNVGYCFEPG